MQHKHNNEQHSFSLDLHVHAVAVLLLPAKISLLLFLINVSEVIIEPKRQTHKTHKGLMRNCGLFLQVMVYVQLKLSIPLLTLSSV